MTATRPVPTRLGTRTIIRMLNAKGNFTMPVTMTSHVIMTVQVMVTITVTVVKQINIEGDDPIHAALL
jgi:hypothetical protein